MWASGKKAAGGGWTATPSRFLAKLITAAQTVATASWVKVLFNSTVYDALSEFDDTVNNRFVATETGIYIFYCSFMLETPGTAQPWEVQFQVNGGAGDFTNNGQGVATVSHDRPNMSGPVSLAAGEYVEVYMHHYKGSNADIEIGAVFGGHRIA